MCVLKRKNFLICRITSIVSLLFLLAFHHSSNLPLSDDRERERDMWERKRAKEKSANRETSSSARARASLRSLDERSLFFSASDYCSCEHSVLFSRNFFASKFFSPSLAVAEREGGRKKPRLFFLPHHYRLQKTLLFLRDNHISYLRSRVRVCVCVCLWTW